jgi:hypothetical protein
MYHSLNTGRTGRVLLLPRQGNAPSSYPLQFPDYFATRSVTFGMHRLVHKRVLKL